MKNSMYVLIAAMFLVLIASSCKTPERCPAYGQVTETAAENKA